MDCRDKQPYNYHNTRHNCRDIVDMNHLNRGFVPNSLVTLHVGNEEPYILLCIVIIHYLVVEYYNLSAIIVEVIQKVILTMVVHIMVDDTMVVVVHIVVNHTIIHHITVAFAFALIIDS